MGFLDKVKGAVSGPAVSNMVEKLLTTCQDEVIKIALEKIKAQAEDKAKESLTEICANVLKDQVKKIDDPTGIAHKLGDKIVEEATPKLVDKVWDKVKDKIVRKDGGAAHAH